MMGSGMSMAVEAVQLIKIASVVFSILSFSLVGIVILFGVIRRPGKVMSGLALTLVAALFAFIAAMLLRKPLSGVALRAVMAALDDPIPLKTGSVTYQWLTGLFGSLVAPLLFAVIFFFTKIFLCFFNALFAKLFDRISPTNGWKWLVKLGVGALNGLLIMSFLLVPSIGFAETVTLLDSNPAVRSTLAEISNGRNFVYYADKIAGAADGNAAVAVARVFGGRPIYKILSTVTVDGDRTSLNEQLDRSANVAGAAVGLIDAAGGGESILSPEFAEKLEELSKELKNNPELSAVIADLVSSAAESIKETGSFGKITVDLPKEGPAAPVARAALESLENMKEDSASRILDAAAGAINVLNGTGASEALKDKEKSPLSALAVPGAVSGVLKAIKDCPELSPLAEALASVGVEALSEGLGLEGEAAKNLSDALSFDLENMTDEQAESIEKIVSSADKVLESINGKEGTDIITSLDASALQELTDAIDGSGIVEGGTGTLLDALSESDKLKETGLIDKDTVEKLKESGLDNLESTIGASQKSVSIIDQLTSENPDEASIKEDLQWLVDNMDDTTSDFITSQITADKLTSFGISPLSAPGVERFIKILTEEIKSAQDDPAVDSEKESAALVSVYTLAIGADTSGGDLFAEGKSDPQVLADSVFGSRIVGNTVVRTAIEDGKLTVDPIGCGISLSNADRNALVSAINTSLSAAGYASADAAAKQKLSDRAVSLAAFFGLNGSVSSAGVLTVG